MPPITPVKMPEPLFTPTVRLRAPAQFTPEVLAMVTVPAPVKASRKTGLPFHRSKVAVASNARAARLLVQTPPWLPPLRRVTPCCKLRVPPVIWKKSGFPPPLLSSPITPAPVNVTVPPWMKFRLRMFAGAV